MDKNKQIEEMAKAVCHLDRTCDECMTSFECKAMMYAKRFYDAGYRKASVVIEEILVEMEHTIKAMIALLSFSRCGSPDKVELEKACYKNMLDYIAELKKKYTEE